jgi:hypothetical protein
LYVSDAVGAGSPERAALRADCEGFSALIWIGF